MIYLEKNVCNIFYPQYFKKKYWASGIHNILKKKFWKFLGFGNPQDFEKKNIYIFGLWESTIFQKKILEIFGFWESTRFFL